MKTRAVIQLTMYTLLFSIVMAGFWGLGFWSFNVIEESEYFNLRSVEVYGQNIADSKKIMELAEIKPGMFLFDIDMEKTRKNLLDAPLIKDAAVNRKLPDQLVIKVEERLPYCLVLIAKRLYVADRDGVVFMDYDYKRPLDLPVVTGISLDSESDLSGLIPGLKKVTDALNILETKKRKLFEMIEEVEVTASSGLELRLINDTCLRVGESFDNDKIAYLNEIENRLKKGHFPPIKYIDLRFSRQAAIGVTGVL